MSDEKKELAVDENEKPTLPPNDSSELVFVGPPTLQDYIREAEVSRSDELHHNLQSESSSGEKGRYDDELVVANRALRTAGWISVFYLITTDILGPFNAPFAISQVGYVPGIILYVVMGGVACYTGLILWHLFCKLDSYRYPVKTYSDLINRIFGKTFMHISTVLQSLQLIINVGTICLANGQAVEQIAANNKFCFSVAILIWALVGMAIGQIRGLKNYGWLANSAVWINLLIIFTSMGFVSHSPPNIASAQAAYGPQIGDGPVQKAAFVSQTLPNKVNGIMNMVFAYGGAMIFPEFMAEMRRPMDFWKGMVCAQLLICTAYLLYGAFVYSFQGQYTLPLAFQGVSKQSWQDVGNILGLITGIIAAGLYGNIGIKVAYYSIVEEWFKGPKLISKKGRVVWTFMVFIYWALAFIIGSAIPQVQTISGLVAAICIMQFTYTFPPLLLLGYNMRVNAGRLRVLARSGSVNGSSDSETTGSADPGDSWWGASRWRRALFGAGFKQSLYNLFNLVLFLGSAALACLGMFGSGTAIRETFKHAAATSFGCKSPV